MLKADYSIILAVGLVNNGEVKLKVCRFFVSFPLLAVLLLFGLDKLHAQEYEAVGSSLFKNLTTSVDLEEVAPTFVQDGASVVFMEFTGDPFDPKVSDYRLVLTDREGTEFKVLTTSGVVQYWPGPGRNELSYMTVPANTAGDTESCSAKAGMLGTFWTVNLDTGVLHRDEPGSRRSPVKGQGMYGALCQDLKNGELVLSSPDASATIKMAQERAGEQQLINLFHLEDQEMSLVHTTELYLTGSHFGWRPEMLWRDERSFLTLKYVGSEESETGEWSIMEITLDQNESAALYRSKRIKPFPRMALDVAAGSVCFQQTAAASVGTELWRLNLATGAVDMIYRTQAELGEISLSPVGSSLVTTQLLNDRFDIIRVDFDLNRLERLAVN